MCKPLNIKSLGAAGGKIRDITLLGDRGEVQWTQHDNALVIDPPKSKLVTDYAVVYKITLASDRELYRQTQAGKLQKVTVLEDMMPVRWNQQPGGLEIKRPEGATFEIVAVFKVLMRPS